MNKNRKKYNFKKSCLRKGSEKAFLTYRNCLIRRICFWLLQICLWNPLVNGLDSLLWIKNFEFYDLKKNYCNFIYKMWYFQKNRVCYFDQSEEFISDFWSLVLINFRKNEWQSLYWRAWLFMTSRTLIILKRRSKNPSFGISGTKLVEILRNEQVKMTILKISDMRDFGLFYKISVVSNNFNRLEFMIKGRANVTFSQS